MCEVYVHMITMYILDYNATIHLYFVILETDEAASTCHLFVQKGGLQMMAQALKVSCFTIFLVWFMSGMPEYTVIISFLCS